MNLIDTLERRFGRYAIPGLGRIIVAFNALVFVLGKFNPAMLDLLRMDPFAIRHGQLWRLVTYIFIPDTQEYLWILFVLWFLWMLVEGLEQAWGAFRFNLYYLLGMIGTTAAAFFFGAEFSNTILNLSLLFAFAWFYPDVQISLYLILPIRIKWVAWFTGALLLYSLVTKPMAMRMAIVAALVNYLIFFGPAILAKARHRHRVTGRRRQFQEASLSEEEPLHRCAVCHRSELDSPDLEFRVARDGNDYCMEHLPKPSGRSANRSTS